MNARVSHFQRYSSAAVLVIGCFAHLSCISPRFRDTATKYRLSYVAQIEVSSDKGRDQLAPTDSHAEAQSPVSAQIVKNVYRYEYYANYSMGLLGHLGAPTAADQEDIEKRATANLQSLLAGRDYRIKEIQYNKVKQAPNQPDYLLIDRDGTILAKGNASTVCSLEDAGTCPDAQGAQVKVSTEAAARQTQQNGTRGLSEAAAIRGFSFPEEAEATQDANALSKRRFVIGHLHMSAVLGLGAQLGYRLTDRDSLSLSHVYDWYTEYSSNSFVGVSYQRYFANFFFIQTSLGRLESKTKNYEKRSEWYGQWYSSTQIGLAANASIGSDWLLPSGLILGVDAIGFYFGISRKQDGLMWPKLRIGKAF